MRNGFHFIGKDYFIKTPTKRDNTGNYTDYNTGRELMKKIMSHELFTFFII